MKCPKCQFENREGAKFCNKCGHKFELTCPKCGTTNRPGSKFCDECGYNLALSSEPAPKELSFDEKLDRIQRYLPKGLTEKILVQRDKIEGERKQITVMFCDMEGFTQLSERLGPEQAYDIMDQVYEILIYKVRDYEGTVNEMTGDGIMALFGAPIALEDAPQRAIRSALAIHREMAKFSDNYQKRLAGIYTAFGTYNLLVEEDYSKGTQYLNEVVKSSEETKNYFALWYANLHLGLSLSWNCEFERGFDCFRKILSLSGAVNNW